MHQLSFREGLPIADNRETVIMNGRFPLPGRRPIIRLLSQNDSPLAIRRALIRCWRVARERRHGSSWTSKRASRASAVAFTVALLPWLMVTDALASDRDVQTQLQQMYTDAGWRDVRIAVDHGIVTLTGEVPHAWARDQIEKEAQRVSGVMNVVNDVSIMGLADDTTLKKTIESQVQQWVLGTVFDEVSVNVLSGTAVLTGYLTTPYKLSPLVDLVARTPGVRHVLSEIEILPDSAVDEHLRMTLAAALYRDVAFGDAAIQRARPIRIIVRNARVTLDGRVRTNHERTMAEDIVRGVAGVLSVDNRLLVTDMPS